MMDRKKIFFLHIPKTAGTSFNQLFRSIVPEGAYFEHLESDQAKIDEILEREGRSFLSGHLPFRRSKSILRRDDVFSFTVMRDPLQQLLSHLRWVKAYGAPDASQRRKTIPATIAELSLMLWETPLDDLKRMETILGGKTAIHLFDNLQTRYLAPAGTEKVTNEHVEMATRSLREFSFFFTIGDQQHAIKHLRGFFPRLGEAERLNVNPYSERIDTRNPEFAAFYAPYIEHDTSLFHRCRWLSRKNHMGLDKFQR